MLMLTVIDTLASFDGPWQKRGYGSLNGVVTTMSAHSKCRDVEIMSDLQGEEGNTTFY